MGKRSPLFVNFRHNLNFAYFKKDIFSNTTTYSLDYIYNLVTNILRINFSKNLDLRRYTAGKV